LVSDCRVVYLVCDVDLFMWFVIVELFMWFVIVDFAYAVCDRSCIWGFSLWLFMWFVIVELLMWFVILEMLMTTTMKNHTSNPTFIKRHKQLQTQTAYKSLQ
jgi:hypothetical protein